MTLVVKNLPGNAGDWDTSSIPGLGRSFGEERGNPLQHSCLENPMGRSLVGYMGLHGVAKSRTWLKQLAHTCTTCWRSELVLETANLAISRCHRRANDGEDRCLRKAQNTLVQEPETELILSDNSSWVTWLFPGSSDGKVSARDARGQGSIPGSGRSPGEGNGNPLQYSCLENSMEGGAWWATVHGVAKSRTQLGDFIYSLTLPWESDSASGSLPAQWKLLLAPMHASQSYCHPFIHWFSKHLWNFYSVSVTVLGTGKKGQ